MKESKLITWTIVELDLFDRLRVLFGAKINLKVTTFVPDHDIEMYNAKSELTLTHKSKKYDSQNMPRYGMMASEVMSVADGSN